MRGGVLSTASNTVNLAQHNDDLTDVASLSVPAGTYIINAYLSYTYYQSDDYQGGYLYAKATGASGTGDLLQHIKTISTNGGGLCMTWIGTISAATIYVKIYDKSKYSGFKATGNIQAYKLK